MKQYILLTLGLILLAVGTATITATYTHSYNTKQARETELVQTICDKARAEVSGSSEQACGLAQDLTSKQYICRDFTYSTSCWVERV